MLRRSLVKLYDNSPRDNLGPGKLHMWGVFDPKYTPASVRWVKATVDRFRWAAVKLIKLGDKFMGYRPQERLYSLRRVVAMNGNRPLIRENCFVAPNAVVIGEVEIDRKATVGYQAVVRGDQGKVFIGESSTIHDKATVTGASQIGKWVTIDPMAVIDNATVSSCSYVGAGSIVMRGAKIESNAMLTAASVLRAGTTIPSGEIWSGNPAEKLGDLTEEEKEYIIKAAKHMVLINLEHSETWESTWEEMDNFRIGRELWAVWAENMYEFRVRANYNRNGPTSTTRPNQSPLEMMQGRLQTGFEEGSFGAHHF